MPKYHKALTKKEIQGVIDLQESCLAMHVHNKEYDKANDAQVAIHILKVVLGQYDNEGNVTE